MRLLAVSLLLVLAGCAAEEKIRIETHEVKVPVLQPCPGNEVRPDFDDKVLPPLSGAFDVLSMQEMYVRVLEETKSLRNGANQRDGYIRELENALANCRKAEGP